MAERNSNLRKLAAAYAQGKLDKVQYRNLRTRQLAALDYNKPVPDLPSDISHIRVPKQGEAPNKRNQSLGNAKIFIIIGITLAVCALTYFLIT